MTWSRILHWFVGFAVATGFLLASRGIVEAHHNLGGILPLVPNTPLIRNLWQDGMVNWCVDARAATYPNFVSQLHRVNDAAYQAGGVPHQQVAWGSGCEVQHTMPDDLQCGGCAARIWYANWPVKVEYRWQLGYLNWDSTQAHEGTSCGHAMGEHEAYDDINFVSHLLTYGYWASPWNGPTVMDFGTGVWACTENDVRLMHGWLLPKPVSGPWAGYKDDGRAKVWYCDGDTLRATRIAVMKRDFVFGTYWFGQHIAVVGQGQCAEAIVDGNPGDCFAFNQEIEPWFESWAWDSLRNDVNWVCF